MENCIKFVVGNRSIEKQQGGHILWQIVFMALKCLQLVNILNSSTERVLSVEAENCIRTHAFSDCV